MGPFNEPVVVALGDPFSFRCENNDGQIPSWYKNGNEVLHDVWNVVVVPFHEGGSWGSDLTVLRATFGDAGIYECRNAAAPSNWASVAVEVIGQLKLHNICHIFYLKMLCCRGRNKAEAHGSQQGYLVKYVGSP